MKYKIKAVFILAILTSLLPGCSKQTPKDTQNTQQAPNNQMPDDSIHKNPMKNSNNDPTDTKGDDKAEQLSKEADDADSQFQKTKSDADKKTAIDKQMKAANYLMFEANLSPKKKYRPALKRYRRVLELDPKNEEAQKNKKQLEDIYQSMGMPIPD